jgi:large subunit ribosomal protein L10
LNRDEKATVVEELSGKFAKAKIAVVTDYRGLTVPVFQELRRELRKNNAEIRVAKNTLLRRAVQGTPFEAMDEHFTGTSAITVSNEDPVSPAKVLVEFGKGHPQLTIRGAVLDGKALTPDDIVALSRLPGKDVLLAKLLSVMQAVPTNFVQVLSGVPRKMVYLLQAVRDKKEQTDN